ncbi:serine protease [Mortierella sp. GBAus27b]|nr:subtilisin-like serine protease [Mortierella sp. GBA43]KAI8351359.1 serine protease [Mortierella sp. GBAus27b]
MKFSIVIAVCIGFAQGAPLIALSQGIKAVPDSYIVVLKNHESASTFQLSFNTLAIRLQADVVKTEIVRQFNLIPAFHVRASPNAVKELQSNPDVDYIEHDAIVSINSIQQPNPPSWGLTRISERVLDLKQSYVYNEAAGAGVTVYVLDTGILKEHVDFRGRVLMGANFVDQNFSDENGHGTHVAGTIAGTTYGVAKRANIVDVKVLGADGTGPISGIISGMQWAFNDARSSRRPSIMNMSLGTSKNAAMDDAARAVVGSGIHLVAAAGNNAATDACSLSPGGSGAAIMVGASDDTDTVAKFSSNGPCVTIFAPGVNITSSWIGSPTAMKTISGTSMAAPHVAGIVALLIAQYGNTSPSNLRGALQNAANKGVLQRVPSNTVNLLAFNSL